MCWGVSLGRRRVGRPLPSFLFSYVVEYNLLRCFLFARHLAANSGIRASASPVCFIFACGG
jgi:hypothetical protein